MQTCGATRVLFPAAFVGLVVSVFTQNEPLAWVAAIGTGLVALAFQRIRGRSLSCPVPADDATTAHPDDVDETDSPAPVDQSDDAVTTGSARTAAVR